MKAYITRTVLVLSLVSLATDAASEMLYPVMPMFLQQIGFSVLFIGILEGMAEAVAGLSKSYFGKWSDQTQKRVPFVRWGYALSAISKPLMGIFIFPLWIFFSRTIDRLGKGIRTGARDAMLSAETTRKHKAKVFGFHRSMDTLGAVFGPLLALLFLYLYPGKYRILFFIAFIPGIIAIACTFLLKDKKTLEPSFKKQPVSLFTFAAYWRTSNKDYKKLVAGLLLFALVNSSDIFLLLKMKEAGRSDIYIIGIYIFYNLVYAMMAFPVGIIADKLGLKKTFISGLLMFAMVYAGFCIDLDGYLPFILFFIYGIYAAATESIAKAWITNIVHQNETATAIGTYTGFQSIAALIASSAAGLIWFSSGAIITFMITAIMALVLIAYFSIVVRNP